MFYISYWVIPEKNRTGAQGYTFLKKKQAFQRKQAFTPANSAKFCDTPLGKSKVKNQGPWKFHIVFFSINPRISTSFLIDPWNFHMLFLQYCWKFHSMTKIAKYDKRFLLMLPFYWMLYLENPENFSLNIW